MDEYSINYIRLDTGKEHTARFTDYSQAILFLNEVDASTDREVTEYNFII